MVGTSPPRCGGFIESQTYADSRALLDHLSDEEIDDRLDALLWALRRDSALVAAQVPGRNLWVAITDHPHLRIYFRPRENVTDECELLWIEEPPP